MVNEGFLKEMKKGLEIRSRVGGGKLHLRSIIAGRYSKRMGGGSINIRETMSYLGRCYAHFNTSRA